MLLYLPLSIWMMVFTTVPTLVALVSSLPLYMLLLQFVISLVGLYEFTSVHKLRPSLFSPFRLALAYLPYQWLLSFGAMRALVRHLRGMNNWEKTRHTGAHRQEVSVPLETLSPAFDQKPQPGNIFYREDVIHG
jgi:hypothetical protein